MEYLVLPWLLKAFPGLVVYYQPRYMRPSPVQISNIEAQKKDTLCLSSLLVQRSLL